MQIHIRPVSGNDFKEITRIYNYYVENTTITFEETPVTEEEMKKTILNISSSYPYFVCEVDGKVKGYAYISTWRTKSGFRYSAESTVYLHKEVAGMGIGQKLLEALIEKVRSSTPIHALIAFITLPNDASVHLHEKLGFNKVAHYHEAGFKFNQWIDLGSWELIL